jgi:hypothetical protein
MSRPGVQLGLKDAALAQRLNPVDEANPHINRPGGCPAAPGLSRGGSEA